MQGLSLGDIQPIGDAEEEATNYNGANLLKITAKDCEKYARIICSEVLYTTEELKSRRFSPVKC